MVKNLPTTQECVLVAQSCPILCDPMDYSPPGSSVHGILQARISEWVAISFSSNAGDWVQSLGQEDPLAKRMAAHSSILAWEIPWTKEPGGL